MTAAARSRAAIQPQRVERVVPFTRVENRRWNELFMPHAKRLGKPPAITEHEGLAWFLLPTPYNAIQAGKIAVTDQTPAKTPTRLRKFDRFVLAGAAMNLLVIGTILIYWLTH